MESHERVPQPDVHAIPARMWPTALAVCILALLYVHLLFQFDRFTTNFLPAELHALFDLDEEQNVPSWFSGAQLLVAAALAWTLASAARRVTPGDARAWSGLAAALAFMSLDEIAGIHETFNTLFVMSWTVPFGILALVIGAILLPFVRRLPARTRNGIGLAGAVYLAGAVGMELLTSRFFDQDNKRQFSYALMTLVEEGLEMTGVWILIRTLLAHMSACGITLAVLREPRAGRTR